MLKDSLIFIVLESPGPKVAVFEDQQSNILQTQDQWM